MFVSFPGLSKGSLTNNKPSPGLSRWNSSTFLFGGDSTHRNHCSLGFRSQRTS